MTGLDWIIVAVMLLSVITAAAQGFFFEVFSLAGTLFGYLLAAWEHWRLVPWFEQYTKSWPIANAAAFITIFFCVLILFSIAGKVTRWVMRGVGLTWADRLLGAAFGLVRGALICTLLVLAATAYMPQAAWLANSQLRGYFQLIARNAVAAAPAEMKEKFHEGVELLRHPQGQPAAPDGPQQKK